MSTVFVVQEPGIRRHGRVAHRYSMKPAEKFGTLAVLLDWSEAQDLGSKDGKAEADMLWKIRRRLEGFRADRDFILMTGNWTAMALAVAVALEMGEGRIKCLQWDKDDRDYKVIPIDINAPPPPPREEN